MTEYTSPCPYFVAMTDPDETGERKLLCKTRAKPYTGALYDSGCSPDSKPGYDGCRLYWLKRIQDDPEAPAPREIEQGSVKAMQAYYEAQIAKRSAASFFAGEPDAWLTPEGTIYYVDRYGNKFEVMTVRGGCPVPAKMVVRADKERQVVVEKLASYAKRVHFRGIKFDPQGDIGAQARQAIAIAKEKAKCQTTPPAACACQSCEKPDCICAGGLNFYGRESCNGHNNCAQSGCSYAARHRTAPKEGIKCQTTPPAPSGAAAATTHAPAVTCAATAATPTTPAAANTSAGPLSPVVPGTALADANLSPASTAPLPVFDYTEVDDLTGRRLAELQDEAYRARGTYIITMARIVGEAHDLLASYHGGMFMAWCKRIGLSLGTTQNFLTVSQLLRNSTDEELKVLETQPATLLYSAARKDAPAELVQAVKDGDITSNKQYQDALAQLEAEKAARREAEKRTKGLEDSYRTAHANEEYAIKRAKEAEQEAEEARKERDGARQAMQASKLRGDKLKEENEALKARPIEVKGMDPDEVDKLAREKAEEITAELREHINELKARAATGDPNACYDQVLLAARSIESTWGIAKSAYRQLPADMRGYLAGLLRQTFDKCKEELRCL